MIIGLLGTKRSGKDTIADFLVEKYVFVKYSLADPMKKAVREIFLMTEEQLWGDKKEVIDPRYNTTPRKILQVFGTELFQYDIYKHIPELSIPARMLWINRFKQWYNKMSKGHIRKAYHGNSCVASCNVMPIENVVISDVRFPHEVEEIRKLGGFVFRVIRHDLSKDEHVSETEQKDIKEDVTIYNNGTIIELFRKIDKIMSDKYGLYI